MEHIDGSMSLAESADALAAMVADTASGTPSKSEALGHKEFHILYKYQSKEVLPCES
jgi:altronate hydrolase